jgi:anti-anti-sigma factor
MSSGAFFETPRLRARPFTYDDLEAFVATAGTRRSSATRAGAATHSSRADLRNARYRVGLQEGPIGLFVKGSADPTLVDVESVSRITHPGCLRSRRTTEADDQPQMQQPSRPVRNVRCDMTSPPNPGIPDSSRIPQQRGKPEDGCRVTLLYSDSQALLVVSGDIDLDTVQTLRDALCMATSECSHVLVDLDNVTFIGAAGLDALVAAKRACQPTRCRLQVVTTNPFTLKLLTLTGLRHLTPSA